MNNEKICEVCEGTGEEEVFATCNVYIGDCCGGCTKTRSCEACNGTGEVDND